MIYYNFQVALLADVQSFINHLTILGFHFYGDGHKGFTAYKEGHIPTSQAQSNAKLIANSFGRDKIDVAHGYVTFEYKIKWRVKGAFIVVHSPNGYYGYAKDNGYRSANSRLYSKPSEVILNTKATLRHDSGVPMAQADINALAQHLDAIAEEI